MENSKKVVVAVDAHGGDNAPACVLEGVKLAVNKDPNLYVELFGDKDAIESFCTQNDKVNANFTTKILKMSDDPELVIKRQFADCSIVQACKAVKNNQAQAFFSAGSTGACAAAASVIIRRFANIKRPCIISALPSPKGSTILADMGANPDCSPENLLQFGQMASLYAQNICGIQNPKIGLLSNGEEDCKGNSFTKETHALLCEKLDGFKGNAESPNIIDGSFDIVLADGFCGNIALKAIEGTSKMLMSEIKSSLMSSLKSKIGALLIKNSLYSLKEKMSDDIGGAILLGVQGVVVIGHGNSKAKNISDGILTSAKMARSNLINKMNEEFGKR
ncbi:MAG: phosphate acyltransferase PlsX [Coriobacteriales bacterium]|nr:phosphate acyltransferase PlsX [Coriobacteriales bacterium]